MGVLGDLNRYQAVPAGQLTAESLVWTAGMEAWTPVGRVSRLAALFAPPPPPTAW